MKSNQNAPTSLEHEAVETIQSAVTQGIICCALMEFFSCRIFSISRKVVTGISRDCTELVIRRNLIRIRCMLQCFKGFQRLSWFVLCLSWPVIVFRGLLIAFRFRRFKYKLFSKTLAAGHRRTPNQPPRAICRDCVSILTLPRLGR